MSHGALALDASREEVLAHATDLIAAAWRSFDHYRPSEPPIDEHVRALISASTRVRKARPTWMISPSRGVQVSEIGAPFRKVFLFEE